MIPSQSLLTVTSTMSLYKKALRGRRGPAGSKGTTAVPGQPTSSEACPPTLQSSTPLLLCPCQCPARRLWGGLPRVLPELCHFLRGLPVSQPPVPAGGCEGGPVARSGAWGSDSPTTENRSGTPTSFLPSFGASLGRGLITPRQLTRPDHLPFQVSC